MKKLFLNIAGIAITVCLSASAIAQSTPGTLTFVYSQAVPSGTSATKNVMAIWIENNAGTFIKTKARFVASGTNDHLPIWMSKSSGGAATSATSTSCNIVDATTGATRTATTAPAAFGSKTIVWNGTDVSGAVVADGIYKIWIESSYCNPQPANGTHWLITSFSFTKSATVDHLTPAGDANFSGITIDWVTSSTTGVENISENPEITTVFPNPTNGILNVAFVKANNIKVINALGTVVYEEKLGGSGTGTKSIDLSNFANGFYFINVSNEIGFSENRIMLNK